MCLFLALKNKSTIVMFELRFLHIRFSFASGQRKVHQCGYTISIFYASTGTPAKGHSSKLAIAQGEILRLYYQAAHQFLVLISDLLASGWQQDLGKIKGRGWSSKPYYKHLFLTNSLGKPNDLQSSFDHNTGPCFLQLPCCQSISCSLRAQTPTAKFTSCRYGPGMWQHIGNFFAEPWNSRGNGHKKVHEISLARDRILYCETLGVGRSSLSTLTTWATAPTRPIQIDSSCMGTLNRVSIRKASERPWRWAKNEEPISRSTSISNASFQRWGLQMLHLEGGAKQYLPSSSSCRLVKLGKTRLAALKEDRPNRTNRALTAMFPTSSQRCSFCGDAGIWAAADSCSKPQELDSLRFVQEFPWRGPGVAVGACWLSYTSQHVGWVSLGLHALHAVWTSTAAARGAEPGSPWSWLSGIP